MTFCVTTTLMGSRGFAAVGGGTLGVRGKTPRIIMMDGGWAPG